MKLSAVICTRNRPDCIGRAVASVLANDHPDFELIVVDQSDSDATWRALDAIAAHPKLIYIHTKRVGLSAAYNVAIARSSGEVLAFTDDDCVAPPDWLRQIEHVFGLHADVDLLYGQVLLPDELRGVPGVVPTLSITTRHRISRQNGFVIYGMGANFAARRRLFDIVGGFDEILGGGGPLRSSQDFDFQYRVYRAGLVTLLEPTVRIDHYGLRTFEDWPKTMAAYGVGNGGFYMKHLRCGDPFAAWLLVRDIGWHLPRLLIKPLLRRPHVKTYLPALLRGLRESFKFAVDRDRRLYISPQSNMAS